MLAGGHAGVSRYTDALTRALDRVVPAFPELTLEAVTTRATAETSTFENIAVTPAGLPLGAEGRGWVGSCSSRPSRGGAHSICCTSSTCSDRACA